MSYIRESYSFDDVLLVPRYSKIKSRKQVSVEPPPIGYPSRRGFLEIPMISAPMDTVTEHKMALKMIELGGLGIIHRFMPITKHIMELEHLPKEKRFACIGLKKGKEILDEIMDNVSIEGVCVDVAHGHHKEVIKLVEKIRHMDNHFKIIVGNVATKKGFDDLQQAGADAVKVGIGSGSICSTRLVTGFGVPQLTAIKDCAQMKDSALLIADGGIRNPGDMVKALAAGADYIMGGSIFAGADEAAKPDIYRGMASSEVRKDVGLDESHSPEGVSFYISQKGPVKNVVDYFIGGLRSALSYAGVTKVKELQRVAKFTHISHASIVESKTTNHNI